MFFINPLTLQELFIHNQIYYGWLWTVATKTNLDMTCGCYFLSSMAVASVKLTPGPGPLLPSPVWCHMRKIDRKGGPREKIWNISIKGGGGKIWLFSIAFIYLLAPKWGRKFPQFFLALPKMQVKWEVKWHNWYFLPITVRYTVKIFYNIIKSKYLQNIV